MRHLSLGRVARSSRPGPVRPGDPRMAPDAPHRTARVRRQGICPIALRTRSVHPVGICPIAPQSRSAHLVGICPNRTGAAAALSQPASARHASLKPSAATPSAFVRWRAGASANHLRTSPVTSLPAADAYLSDDAPSRTLRPLRDLSDRSLGVRCPQAPNDPHASERECPTAPRRAGDLPPRLAHAGHFVPTAAMSFLSIYRHGFARVAACTTRCAHRRPGGQRRSHPARPRDDATRRRVRWRCSPSCALSGYAIDDLLLQDALLDAVERAVGGAGRRLRASCCRCCSFGAPLRHAGRVYNTAVAVHRGRLLGVVPKIHLPNYREFYERRHFASGDGTDGGEIRARPAGGARSGPTCCSRPRTCPASWCTPRSARTSGCRPAQRRRRAGRRHGARQPLGQQHHHRQGRHAAAALPVAVGALPRGLRLRRRRRGRIHDRPRLGRPGLDLRERRPARPRRERFPAGDRIAVADVDLDLLRQERMRHGDLRRQPAPPPRRRAASGASPSASTRRWSDVGFERRVERFPFVPADPARLAQDCYEAYNIQVSGLVQRLRRGAGPAHRHRRLRRARFHPGADRGGQGDGPARAPAHRHPRLHHAGLRHERGHQGQRPPADASRSA